MRALLGARSNTTKNPSPLLGRGSILSFTFWILLYVVIPTERSDEESLILLWELEPARCSTLRLREGFEGALSPAFIGRRALRSSSVRVHFSPVRTAAPAIGGWSSQTFLNVTP